MATLGIMWAATMLLSVIFSYGFLQSWFKAFTLSGVVCLLTMTLALPSSHLLRRWQQKGLRAESLARYHLQLLLLCLGLAFVLFFPSMEFSKRVFGNGHLSLDRVTASFVGIPVMFVYALAWVYTYMGILDERSAKKASERHDDAEGRILGLAALLEQARIQPHFLYNTLSLIRHEIKGHPENALTALDSLADFLHLTTDLTEEPVTIEQEFALTESYLRIHEQRTAGVLQASLTLDPLAKPVLVPPLILQPLAENALKYGRWKKDQMFRLEIKASQDGENTRLTVTNPGELSAAGSRKGYGLDNLRARLLRHSESSTVSVSAQGDSVVAEIDFPSLEAEITLAV